MELTEAIKILEEWHTLSANQANLDLRNARNLGIEALKFLSICRYTCPLYIKDPLPGETPPE